jgi:hypothetical protein
VCVFVLKSGSLIKRKGALGGRGRYSRSVGICLKLEKKKMKYEIDDRSNSIV